MAHFIVRIIVEKPNADHDLRLPAANEQFMLLLRVTEASGNVLVHRDDAGSVCFDLLPPHSVTKDAVGEDKWSTFAAEEWARRGFNAARAPAWR